MELHSAGENAIMLYLGNETSPEVSARVQAATRAVATALDEDLVDLVPSYASLLIIYDPMRTDHLSVSHRVRACLSQLEHAASVEGSSVVLPVYYDPEAGEDLESLASGAGLTVDQVIDIHSGCEYRVYAIGFAPGFAYLGQVDERIAAPRLTTPRQRVPRGACLLYTSDAADDLQPV